MLTVSLLPLQLCCSSMMDHPSKVDQLVSVVAHIQQASTIRVNRVYSYAMSYLFYIYLYMYINILYICIV